MSFTKLELMPCLVDATQKLGYSTPTAIQSKTIPLILQNKDLLATAQTGSGKTAAFLLPSLQRLALTKTKLAAGTPRILILTPTRELANQITSVAWQYQKFLPFTVASLVGGTSYRQQLKALARSIDIIVATPGRLIDHLQRKRIDLARIEVLVLDEADRMLEMGFIDAMRQIIKLTPSNRQTLLFSATANEPIKRLAQNFLRNPEIVLLANEKNDKPAIKQRLYSARDNSHKSRLLSELLTNEKIYKAIIFSATKHETANLAKRLRAQGYSAAGLHGDLKQNQRNAVLRDFKGELQFLVATDVASRGLDINDISHVINYDFPRFAEDYVHRIGRTARAGKSGIAISLVLPSEKRHLQRVERYLGQTLQWDNQADVALTSHSPTSRKRKRYRHKKS